MNARKLKRQSKSRPSATNVKKKVAVAGKSPKRAKTPQQQQPSSESKEQESSVRTHPPIHVVTDGTGGLPRHILAAVLSQFPNLLNAPTFDLFCNTAEKVQTAARKMEQSSVVLFALADAELKSVLQSVLADRQIASFDMIGGIVDFVANATGEAPEDDLDRVHPRDEDYFDRIDAWEFTLQHDDSRRLESIEEAEIVLVGLSRVSKTPTAAYLGWLGHRVANVSFAVEVGLPDEIGRCREKLVALTMQPKRLAEIRQRRMRVNHFQEALDADPNKHIKYANIRETVREVMDAETIYKKLNIPIVDTTELTVEETAARVLELLKKA